MYDYVVTLPDEIELVWPASWGPGKILFLLARYVTWPEVTLAIYRSSHPFAFTLLTDLCPEQLFDIPATQCHSFFTYFSCTCLYNRSWATD